MFVVLFGMDEKFEVYLSTIFFFKQKTAYEMRISDWSSDVCSSDLDVDVENLAGAGKHGEMRGDRVPPGVLRQHRAAAAIDAQDQRTAVEGAEHQGDPAVRCKMGVGLVP